MLRKLIALLSLLFLAGQVQAQTSLLPPPPASVCTSPTVPTEPGDVHMFPGRWWNPKRPGLGWDFFYADGQQRMYLTWFTFDPTGRPVWLHGEAAPLTFNAVSGERTWQSRLHLAIWNRSGQRILKQVGLVSVTFPHQTTTRAAVSWTWNVSEGGDAGVPMVDENTHDECLLDTYRDSMSFGESLPQLNQAFSSNWFYSGYSGHPLVGWGVDLLIDKRPADGQYIETATAAIFDDKNRAVWLQSVDEWGINPPAGSTMDSSSRGNLRYIRHRVPNGAHPAKTDCTSVAPDFGDCIYTAYGDTFNGTTNRFKRDITSARNGLMSVKAYVPGDITGGAQVSWPPVQDQIFAFPDPLPVTHEDANHIIVDQSVCRVGLPTDTCTITVSWVTEDSAAMVHRIDLNHNGEATYLAGGLSNTLNQTLRVGDRFQYRLTYTPRTGGMSVTHRTPEVRVLLNGQIADENVEAVDCEQGSGCDLGAHDSTVGAVVGEASAEGGAAAYKIPIAVPPGRSGMDPTLALVYSSRGGNQIAGIGWGVVGLSEIHRCPRTLAQDGFEAHVRLGGGDALCLDGQRLKLVSGVYGEADAVYRTEIDSFVRVRQYGGGISNSSESGKSKTCFSVEQKSGVIAYYGGIPELACSDGHGPSRVVPAGTAATLAWKISRSEDRLRNSIVYRYANHGAGELLIDRILYTGVAGSEGNRVVAFEYESRSGNDRNSRFLAGARIEQTKRLKKITSSVGTDVAWTYKLSYEEPIAHTQTGLYSQRSLLQSVTQCAYSDPPQSPQDPRRAEQCLRPTIIKWNDAPIEFVTRPLSIPGLPPQPPPLDSQMPDRNVTLVGDVDGDGVRELLVSQNPITSSVNRWLVQQTAERGTRSVLDISGIYMPQSFYSLTTDFDGDGRADILAGNPAGGLQTTRYLYRFKSTRGSSFTSLQSDFDQSLVNIPSGGWLLSTDDFDHDGYPDILMRRRPGTCNTAVSSAEEESPQPEGGNNPPYHLAICFYRNTTVRLPGQIRPQVQFAPGVELYVWEHPLPNGGISVSADVNGDGVRDPVIRKTVYLEPGYTVEAIQQILWSIPPGLGKNTACDDTPGDLLQVCAPEDVGLPEPGNGYAARAAASHFIDVNGDGAADLLYALPTNCPAGVSSCSVRGTWNLQLADGYRFRPSVPVQGGDEALLQSFKHQGANLRYANRLPKADVDNDGQLELLYPVELAARHCNAIVATFRPAANGTCSYGPDTGDDSLPQYGFCTKRVWMCANDVAFDLGKKVTGYSLPSLSQMPAADDGTYGPAVAVDNFYSTRVEGAATNMEESDSSLYSMAALRFVPLDNGAWAAETVPLDTNVGSDGIRKRLLMSLGGVGVDNDYFDLYGDGLGDVRSGGGCFMAPRYAKFCRYVGDGAVGPSTFHLSPGAGQPLAAVAVSDLNANVERTYLNENVGASEIAPQPPVMPETVRSIENGLGDVASWIYAPLSSKAGRGPDALPLYEIVDAQASYADASHYYFQASMPVVASFRMSNGIGGELGFRSWDFGYREAIYNHAGRGFLGFRTIIKDQATSAADSGRRLRTATTFHQKFPLIGMVEKIETGIAKGDMVQGRRRDVIALSRQTFTYGCSIAQAGAACDTATGAAPLNFPYVHEISSRNFDLGQAQSGDEVALSEVVTRNYQQGAPESGWDAYGNLKFQEIVERDNPDASARPGFEQFVLAKRSQTINAYDYAYVGDWWVSKLISTTLKTFPVEYSSTHPLPEDATAIQSPQEVVTNFEWNPGDRTASKVTLQPSAADQKLVTYFDYPSPNYGRPVRVRYVGNATEGGAPVERVKRTEYDAQGYFPTLTTEAVESDPASPGNYVELRTLVSHRAKDGKVAETTNPANTRTRTRYDAFGRVLRIETYDALGRRDRQPVKQAWNRCTGGSCGGLVGHGGLLDAATSTQATAAYRVTTVQNGNPTSVAWFDVLGREVKSAVRGFDGTFVVTAKSYDAMGGLQQETVPFPLSTTTTQAPALTTYAYDRLSRLLNKSVVVVSRNAIPDPEGGPIRTDYTYTGQRVDIVVRGSNLASCTPGPWSVGMESRCMAMQRYSSVLGPVRSIDAQGGVTRYWYDIAEHVIAMADAKANAEAVNQPGGRVASKRATISRFDALGRKVEGFDPNQGAWTATFNAFDEPLRQTDARGAVTLVEQRDLAGRMLSQAKFIPAAPSGPPTPAGASRTSVRNVWRYQPGSGLLSEVAHCELAESSSPPANCSLATSTWGESYAYDVSARPEYVTTYHSVLGAARSTLTTQLYYDGNFGREKAIKYPSGLRVQRRFQKFGALRDVLDADTGERLWGLGGMDAWGNVTRQEYGNGIVGEYVSSPVTGQSLTRRWRDASYAEAPAIDAIDYAYDSFGNLVRQRRQASGTLNSDVAENYSYDNLQRLSRATPSTLNLGAVEYGYDAVGNLTKKSDFSVNEPAPGLTAPAYEYPTLPASHPSNTSGCGPNAAVRVRLVGGAEMSYACDKAGNVIASQHSGGGAGTRTLRYDAAGLLTEVQRPGSSGTVTTRFRYSADGKRVFEDLEEQYYPGYGLLQSRHQIVIHGFRGFSLEIPYDSVSNANWGDSHWGNALVRHELGGVVVTYQYVSNQGGGGSGKQVNIAYAATDRLGSPLGLMDQDKLFRQRADNGSYLDTRRSFDAFGQTRESDFRPIPGNAQSPFPGRLGLTPITRQGFTSHEHLDSVGLIHMNGRVYDYQLGRFLSVDPYIQFPLNSQSLNPYSYIHNNPLGGTDPSGYRIAGEGGSGDSEGASIGMLPWLVLSGSSWNGGDLAQPIATVQLQAIDINGAQSRNFLVRYEAIVVTPGGWATYRQAEIVAAVQERARSSQMLSNAIADQRLHYDGIGIANVFKRNAKTALSSANVVAGTVLNVYDAADQAASGDPAGAIETVFRGKSGVAGTASEILETITAEPEPERTDEKSLELISLIRQRMHISKDKNIAFADYTINGQTDHLIGVSGRDEKRGVQAPLERRFTVEKVGSFMRLYDSEVKILEYLNAVLPQGSSGTLYLFSELPVCRSCNGVVKQFSSAYPDIQIIVSSGPPKSP